MSDVWQCEWCSSWNAPALETCATCLEKPSLKTLVSVDKSTQPKRGKSPSRRQKEASKEEAQVSKKQKLENAFFTAWQTYGTGHPVMRQYAVKSQRHVTPKQRKPKTYNIDFAFVDLKFCVEVQGGTYGNGRHSRGAGYAADRKRVRDLSLMGWTVWEYTTDDLQPNTVYDTVLEVSEKIAQIEAGLVEEKAA